MSKKKEDNKLTPFEEQFIDIWFNNNFNGRLAYKHLKPNVANSTADAEASRILNSDRGKDYIEIKQEELRKKEEIKLEYLIFNLKKILIDVSLEETERDPQTGKITSKPDRNSAIKAIDILAKLGGYYTEKRDITSNGQSITPEIKINVIQPKDKKDGN